MTTWHCDGRGWNGHYCGICVVNVETGASEIDKFAFEQTINTLEYLAAIKGASIAAWGDVVKTDSLLVVNQVAGKWRCLKAHLLPLRARLATLVKTKHLKLHHIPRKENLAGHLNEGLE